LSDHFGLVVGLVELLLREIYLVESHVEMALYLLA